MAGVRQSAASDIADLAGARVLIVEARFYDAIADELLTGARAALELAKARVDVLTVPGALEIPSTIAIACDAAAKSGDPIEAVVALGCVIRGETFHFEIVASESSGALMDLSVARRLPIGNGVLTVDNEAQAWARARVSGQNKGGGAAEAALAVLAIKRRVAESSANALALRAAPKKEAAAKKAPKKPAPKRKKR